MVGRAELLCALFFMAGFFVYDSLMNDLSLLRYWKLLMTIALSAAAMFSKEHGIMLLVI